MSHRRKQAILRNLFLLGASLAVLHCARLGEASVKLSEQNMLPSQQIIPGVTKPGMGSSGGPTTWSFWVKNRQASSDAMLGSFTPFYKVNAIRLAVSTHFVFYRDALDATINAGQAATVLTTMENAYTNLMSVYGAGEHPYANNNARVVILAYNIQDDYATTGNYVGGYFSPRDLYSNAFTMALYTDPVALQQYSNYIGTLGGYSNEMSLINYDLNPGYSSNSAQVNDIVLHELSHLFTYSRRVLKERLTNHDLWIAEGIAENAADQTQKGLPANTHAVQQLRLTQLASPSTIDYYQDAPQLTDFLNWAAKIVGYLQSNLFFNYLRHRAEMTAGCTPATDYHCSSAMFTALMTTGDQSVNGLDTLIANYIPGANFASLYQDFVITHYLMMLGYASNNANKPMIDGVAVNDKYSMNFTKVGDSKATIGAAYLSTYSANIPFNFEAPKCSDGSYGLKPNSYTIFRYKMGSDFQPPDTAGANAVAGELPLKYVVNLAKEADLIAGTSPAAATLITRNANQMVDLGSGGFGLNSDDILHVIVINPNKTGSCRLLDNSLILKRNHSKWVGYNPFGTRPSPDFEWQTETGATWVTNQDGTYYRPGGIAAQIGGAFGSNFLFVLDYNNMSLQKLNLDTGAPLGRLGNVSTSCPTADAGWDTNMNRFINGSCAHHFDAPQGVHVDSAGNIYVADSNNRRIVRYLANGNFNGWMGLDSSDVWQTAANVTDGTTLFNAGAATNPKMFYLPWAVTTDPGDGTNRYLYIADNGARRIIRRDLLLNGAYAGFIGNGKNAWDTSTTVQNPDAGTSAGHLGPASYGPRGMVISGGNMYVADEGHHRIIRIQVSSGNFTGWLGDGYNDWQSMATPPSITVSSAIKYFKNPSAVTTDGTHLYIADRMNNRIVKWRMDSANCTAPASTNPFCGWLGHGRVGWEKTAAAPATDPYAGFSYYPPDYYAEPHGLAIALGPAKNTKRDYLFVTSLYNGRVTRINLGCADAPGSAACDAIYNPLVAPFSP